MREATSTTTTGRGATSNGEYRSKRERYGEFFAAAGRDDLFWRYLTERGPIVREQFGRERLATLS